MWAGRREVRLAGAEADDVLPRRLQRLGLGVDREGGRGRDRGGPARDPAELGRRGGGCRHGCHDFIRARHPRHQNPHRAPALRRPLRVRALQGPTRRRSRRCRRWPRRISAPATARRRSSRRWAGCAAGCRQLFSLPDGYEVVLGNGGTTCFWDAATFGLIEEQSQHLSFGEFSSKFAACAKAAPHLKDPQVIESEVGTHPLPRGRRLGRPVRPHPQRDLDRRRHGDPAAERRRTPGRRGRAGGRRRHLGRRGAAGRPGRVRRLLPGAAEVLRQRRRALDRPPVAGRARAGGADRRLGPLDPHLPRPQDGRRQFGAGPDLQHAGAGHHLPAGGAAGLDERQRRAGVDGVALRPVGRDPLHLGRAVRLRPALRGEPGRPQPRRGHHRLRRPGRRRRRGGGAAGQRHRGHRALPQAGPQPAAHRHVPRHRARRRGLACAGASPMSSAHWRAEEGRKPLGGHDGLHQSGKGGYPGGRHGEGDWQS